jgi:carboxyl-terminal processing protease
MKFKVILLNTILILCCGLAKGQVFSNPQIQHYVDSALIIMEHKSLYADMVDWGYVKAEVYSQTANVETIGECFEALKYAFNQLNDHHGIFANADTLYRLPVQKDYSVQLSQGIKEEYLKGPRIVKEVLSGNIAYLRVPSIQVLEDEKVMKEANALRESLCGLLNSNPRALILDLRMNNGGNSVPMQSGLGPLFTSDTIGYMADKDHKLYSPIVLKNGVSVLEDGNYAVIMEHHCSCPDNLPIAILIGPATASSGEILGLILAAQDNTILIGEPSGGFLNATEGFLWMEKQSYMILSVSRMADRHKKINQKMILEPDIYVKSDDNYDNLEEDITIQKAKEWILGR